MLSNNYFSGAIAPVMDLDYDLSCSYHTPELLKKKINLLAENGFEKLHIVAPPPGNADYSYAAQVVPEEGPPNFLRQSRESFSDDPLKVAVQYAKECNLDVIVVFKPYEGGGVFTIPHNVTPPCNRNYLETLGGRAVGLDPFIVENPEFLLERKPYEQYSDKNVDRIELCFILDDGIASDNVKDVYRDDELINSHLPSDFVVKTSYDNGEYYEINSGTINQYLEERFIRNANEELVFPGKRRCRIIELSTLNIHAPYFSIEFKGNKSAFRTIPFSMCSAFSGKIKLPVTVSPTLRHGTPFAAKGFEFEEIDPYYFDCGWRESTCLGFARGKEKRQIGALCEAYPEVREYWLKQIRYFVEIGADGVEIRFQNHSSGITDFVNYGYNLPLVEAFLNEYGKNMLEENISPFELMKLRGKFFTLFLADAKKILHENRIKLLIHLHGYMERPSLDPTFHELGFWANPKILPNWKLLIEMADELVLKDYNFGKYNSKNANMIKDFCKQNNKPLWIHCYLQQGNDWTRKFLEVVERDKRVSGILLYEVVWNEREKHGIVKVDSKGDISWVLQTL